MSYCINPKCEKRCNQDEFTCSTCHNPLLIHGKYRLLEPLRELNERGNTEVFVVEAAGIPKVLKVLQDPYLLPMFKREVETLKSLRHPGIPRVESDGYFTFVLNNGKELHCLVMEKLEGQNLEQYLEQYKKISQAEALKWLRQLVDILDMLHQRDLFHRDIKLSNIMLKLDGQLALIDFGTVRPMTSTYMAKIGSGREVTSIVSPGYSPIEQVNGKAVPQSDFYALGRCFVHLLTGSHPLDFPEDPQTGELSWRDSAPQVETRLADLIDDLIAPFQGKRPLNTQEILGRLELEKDVPLLKSCLRKQSLRWRFVSNHGGFVLNLLLFLAVLITGSVFLHNAKQLLPKPSTSGLHH